MRSYAIAPRVRTVELCINKAGEPDLIIEVDEDGNFHNAAVYAPAVGEYVNFTEHFRMSEMFKAQREAALDRMGQLIDEEKVG